MIPGVVHAELMFSGPTRTAESPAGNCSLPKLVSDGLTLYAVHTHAADVVGDRFAVVVRYVPRVGWREVARIRHVYQHVGLAMDRARRLHVVFACSPPPGEPSDSCFPGIAASSAPITARHLVFGERVLRDPARLRFDTFDEVSPRVAPTIGHVGIGATSTGITWWSFADATGSRVVGYDHTDSTATGVVATIAPASGVSAFAIHASREDRLYLVGVEADLSGTVPRWLAAVAHSGDLDGLEPRWRVAAVTSGDGGGAFASDWTFDRAGVPIALVQEQLGPRRMSSLLRFEEGMDERPVVLPIGELDRDAKLHVGSDGGYYVVGSGDGAELSLAASPDRGESWTFHSLAVEGLPAELGDTRYFGVTPLRAASSPLAPDNPDALRFFFSGADATSLSQHSYFGTLEIPR